MIYGPFGSFLKYHRFRKYRAHDFVDKFVSVLKGNSDTFTH